MRDWVAEVVAEATDQGFQVSQSPSGALRFSRGGTTLFHPPIEKPRDVADLVFGLMRMGYRLPGREL